MIGFALPLTPLAAAGLLLALRRRPGALAPVAVAALLATLALGGWVAATEPTVAWDWSPAIRTGLAITGFSRVMVLLIPAIATPIIVHAAATEAEGRPRLLALMLAFTGAMLLLVSAADFLMLLVAWELVGAASWALIGHHWQDADNPRAAAQAFLTTRAGDLGLYIASGMLFATTGSFAFADLGGANGWQRDMIAAGVLLAAAAKSAQVPFSPWLFAAMAGPTPVSALLHSATLVAAGAYLLIRVSPDLEAVNWFTWAVGAIGLITALTGGLVAAVQRHAKRALAGSTSAQYGLMFVAVGASSTAAAGAHLVTHAAFKSLLFLGAGVAMHAAGTSSLAGMRLGRALPRIAALSAVGALALAAVPPLGGAWSKEAIVAAAVHASPWLGGGVFAAGLLSAFYAARYQVLAFGSRDPTVSEGGDVATPAVAQIEQTRDPTSSEGGGATAGTLHHRPDGQEAGSLAVLAGITLALSLLWLPGADGLIEDAVGGRLLPSASWELGASVATITLAFGSMWLLARRGRLVSLGLPAGLQEAAGDWLGLPTATRRLVVDPIVSLSRLLARFDDRVVDAGVRAVGRLAAAVSRLSSVRAEWTVDGVVRAVVAATMQAARGSRLTDEAAIDGAVEGSVWVVGIAGERSRGLQTGLAHHYYIMLVAGLAVSVAVLALLALAGRS